MNLQNERVGTIGKNAFGSLMKVIKYNNTHEIWVRFEKGEPIRTTWQNFCNGKVKSPYDRSIYGIGFIGEGVYKVSENNKSTHSYKTWQGMLQRCYDKKHQITHPTYKDCSVCEEWHNFQNFANWYEENYYQVEGEIMCLDKDILIKGNKVYSPDTCVFVPENINKLFVKRNALRGKLPIGVSWDKRRKKYASNLGDNNGKVTFLNFHDTSDEAFQSYKFNKEKLIKQKAIDYKNIIPSKLYETMIKYEVDITD